MAGIKGGWDGKSPMNDGKCGKTHGNIWGKRWKIMGKYGQYILSMEVYRENHRTSDFPLPVFDYERASPMRNVTWIVSFFVGKNNGMRY